jgi:hypothetical protein
VFERVVALTGGIEAVSTPTRRAGAIGTYDAVSILARPRRSALANVVG